MPKDRTPEAWGDAVWHSLKQSGIGTSKPNVCSALAVIAQESGFVANPEVSNLGRLAEDEMFAKLRRMPVISGLAEGTARWFLENRPSKEVNYLSLLRRVRNERDLDRLSRQILYGIFDEFGLVKLLATKPLRKAAEDFNPVKTSGAMQVSVAFAVADTEQRSKHKLTLDEIWKLREELYTLKGGVFYGTRMLLNYRADYPSRLYAFADYNAGRYASRNAAFQFMVAELADKPLDLDGDLLVYGDNGARTKPSLTEQSLRGLDLGLTKEQIRADLLKEKSHSFVKTATYRLVSDAYGRSGKTVPAAMIPQITLKSPKLSRNWTTERFARNVFRRYQSCLAAKMGRR